MKCFSVGNGWTLYLRSGNKWLEFQTLSETIGTLRLDLSKLAYTEIPIKELFELEILDLYNILLSTRGKIYVKAGGTYSLRSAIFSPPKRLSLNSYSGLRDRNFIDPLLEPKDGWWESTKALDSEGCFVVVNVVTYFCSHAIVIY